MNALKKTLAFLFIALLVACQKTPADNHDTTQAKTPSSKIAEDAIESLSEEEGIYGTTEDIKKLLHYHTIENKKIAGEYPIFVDEKYNSINQSIEHFVLKELGENYVGTSEVAGSAFFGGVDILNILIDYNLTDMTERYFQKTYAVDLNSGKEILLLDYLQKKGVDLNKLNQSLNTYALSCQDKNTAPDYCADFSLSDLLEIREHGALDVRDNNGFYILDEKMIIITFNSSSYTASVQFDLEKQEVVIPEMELDEEEGLGGA